MHVGRRQVLFQKRIAFSRHNHRHSGMLISVFHRRMAYPHPRYIRNFVSRPTFMVSDPISVITDSFLFHPVSSLSFMYSRTFSFLITTGTKKTPKMHFSLTLRSLLSSVHTSSHNFLLFFIFFPFLLEFGHTLLTYSFYNKDRIVDKPLTISPLIKRWRYTFVYRHLCFY